MTLDPNAPMPESELDDYPEWFGDTAKSFKYEYGIAFRRQVGSGGTIEPHRWNMTEAEARDWVASWKEDWDDNRAIGARDMFVVIRRPMGEWETVE